MTISIVIPCFNQGKYLPEAIESALEQTRKADEIIVVNDGSTDDTQQIASFYPVKVINQVNKGLSSARNTGIMNVVSDHILFLDADDQLLPIAVEYMGRRAEETEADIVSCSFHCFGVQNNPVILKDGVRLSDFVTANRIPYCSLFKKSALLEVGGYSPRMTWGYEDYHLSFDLLSRGKTLSIVEEPLLMYRTKEQSMITEAQKHHTELMDQIKKDFPSVFQ